MAATTHIHVRDARDRLIDLLGFAQTYPLRDLAVRDEQLTVAPSTAAKIPIENSQKGVLYQLYFDDQLVQRTAEGEQGPGLPIEAQGNGETIILETYKIRDDVTFDILAQKLPWYLCSADAELGAQLNAGEFPPSLRQTLFADRGISFSDQVDVETEDANNLWKVRDKSVEKTYIIERRELGLGVYQVSDKQAYLHQTATVKVGLDTKLKAWIQDAPHLDPALTNPTDAPRIIYYGESVRVEIENSQEGVDYKLVFFEEAEAGQEPQEIVLSVADVRGDLHNIVLNSQPIHEDINIRIRATKVFDPSEGRETQTDLLDAILPLKVRANPALAVSVEPTPIVDYAQTATIKIASAQESASYQLYARAIPDRDFVHGAVPPGIEVIEVPVPGAENVQVRQPPRAETWVLPQGYEPLGAAQPGSGGDLVLVTGGLSDDSLIIVQARKEHRVSPDAPTIASAVQLEQAAVVLARPDPAPPLQARVEIAGEETGGNLEIAGGQPGVFYHFRPSADGQDVARPAYFHQRDDADEALNKGLDQLAVEVDFVLARPLSPDLSGGDLARAAPLPPLLETGSLPTGSALHVQAVKAQTRVATELTHTLPVAALPEIRLQDAVVDAGAATKILVIASQPGDRYQPFLDGQVLKRALYGNGQDLSFNTGALTEDTDFELRVTRPDDEGIAVERVVWLRASVRPAPGDG